MNNWKEAKQAYTDEHLKKSLKQPERRLSALSVIEKTIQRNEPQLLTGTLLFTTYSKEALLIRYENWKGKALSGAEKSVINGLYKFSDK